MNPWKKIDYLAPLVIIALGGFLRFSLLTNQSLWYDEGVALELTDGNTIQSVFDALWGRPGGDKYQPLYYVALFLWRNAFGSSEVALRMLSVIPGVASLVLVWLLTRKIYGDRHASWSILLISVSAFCIYYSQEVRPFSLQLFLGLAQLYYFIDILIEKEKISWKSSIPFGIVTAINFWGGILLVLFSISIAVSHLLAFRDVRRWLIWWSPAIALSIPAFLYYLASPAASDPGGDSTNSVGMPLYKNAAFVIYGLLVGSSYGPPLDFLRSSPSIRELINSYSLSLAFFLGAALLILIALLLYLREHSKNKSLEPKDAFFVFLFIISFIFSAILAVVSGINWMPRHSFFVFLPICIFLPRLLALGQVNDSTKSIFSWERVLPTVALCGLVLLNVISVTNYFLNENYWRDDYRSGAQYIIQNRHSGDASILLWGSPRLMAYYGDSSTLDGRGIKASELASEVDRLTNQAEVVFVAVNREFLWHRSSNSGKASPADVLSSSYNLKDKVQFINFSVYKLERKNI